MVYIHKMSIIKFNNNAPFVTIKDLGRFNSGKYGYSQSGALDLYSYCMANSLLNNPINAPVLEITHGNLKLLFQEKHTQISITGADVSPHVDNTPIKMWSNMIMEPNQELTLKSPKQGLRTYIGIKGNIEVDKILGSVSTSARDNLNHFIHKDINPYGALTKGALLKVKTTSFASLKAIAPDKVPTYQNHWKVGVILRDSYLSKSEAYSLFNSKFKVSNHYNAMSIILEGKSIKINQKNISHGIPLGGIQIPPNGQPIILMHEHQTIGGYPVIGCVCKLDLQKCAQAKTGDTIIFYPKPLKQAQKEFIEFQEKWLIH